MALFLLMMVCAVMPSRVVRTASPVPVPAKTQPVAVEIPEPEPPPPPPLPSPGRVYISADPWGVVTIPGVIAGRETPIRGITLAAGDHRVTIAHAPTGSRITRTVHVASGRAVRCFVHFLPRPTMSCR